MAFAAIAAVSIACVLWIGIPLFFTAADAGNKPRISPRLPSIDNPYCEVTTHLLPEFAEQATSTMSRDGDPVIVLSSTVLSQTPAYANFLMAHECCHHTLGHVRRYYEGVGHLGPQPFYYIRPALKSMELEADCCAAKMLKLTREPDAIEAGRQTMLRFGTEPTGAYYPTGIERAENIASCAAAD